MLGNKAALELTNSFDRDVGHDCPGHVALTATLDLCKFETCILRWKAPKRFPMEQAEVLTDEDSEALGSWILSDHRHELEAARAGEDPEAAAPW